MAEQPTRSGEVSRGGSVSASGLVGALAEAENAKLTRWQRRGRNMDQPDARGLYPWLLLLAGPAWSIFVSRDARPMWLATLALAAFGALWLLTIRNAFRRRRHALAPLAVVMIIALITNGVYGGAWAVMAAAAGIACGVTLRGREVMAVAVPFSVAAGLVTWLTGSSLGSSASLAWGAFTSALVPWIILRLFSVIHELQSTRERLAAAAVEQERTRFSRDMHDLLGHTLSVMVVKAEAVRRLLPDRPDAARAQAADIEQLGRTALAEVRDAVTGYRGRGLRTELNSATSALSDAGIAPTVRVTSGDLPPEADALLGWAVREGVTNVIRHSRASACDIDVAIGPEITLEIRDNGPQTGKPGSSAPGAFTVHRATRQAAGATVSLAGSVANDSSGNSAGSSAGNGLRGLRERVHAQGGELNAGPMPGGGFRLLIRTPNGLDKEVA